MVEIQERWIAKTCKAEESYAGLSTVEFQTMQRTLRQRQLIMGGMARET